MGDPPCWLGSVCLACGRFVEDGQAEGACPYCGAPRTDAEPPLSDAGTPGERRAEGST